MRTLMICFVCMVVVGCEGLNKSSVRNTAPSYNISKELTAILKGKDGETAFIAYINLEQNSLKIERVTKQPEASKSYELWALGAGRSAPESLGVVERQTRMPAKKLGKLEASWLENTTLAVSLEPSGGSVTGKVTGPVLFTGKIVSNRVKS